MRITSGAIVCAGGARNMCKEPKDEPSVFADGLTDYVWMNRR